MDANRGASADGSGDEQRAPDLPGVVVGWRAWTVWPAQSPDLHSITVGETWPARQAMVARCRLQDHPVLSPGCTCGLYAVRDVWTAVRAGSASAGTADDTGIAPWTVLGCVALWDEIVEGEHGWRGAQGYPCLLIAGAEVPEPDRDRLAARYGVPVHAAGITLDALAGMAPLRSRGRDAVAQRAEAVRAALVGTPPEVTLRDTDPRVAVEPLLALLRPERLASLAATVRALLALCVAPDVAAAAFRGATTLGDGIGWQLLGCVIVLVATALFRPIPAGIQWLRLPVCGVLGRPGIVLWRVAFTPGVVLGVLQIVAVWELLAQPDPAWLVPLLAAPVLVTSLGAVAWMAARPVGERVRSWRTTWAGIGVTVVAATTVVGLVACSAAGLGDDLAFLDRTRSFWSARIADNAPPGLCLGDRAGFLSGHGSSAVKCSLPHWGEIAGYVPFGPPPYPGEAPAAAMAASACQRLETGKGLTGPDLDGTFLYPDARTWNGAGHTVDSYAACAVFRRDGSPLPPGQRVDPARRPPGS